MLENDDQVFLMLKMQMALLRHTIITNMNLYDKFFKVLQELAKIRDKISVMENSIEKVQRQIERLKDLKFAVENFDE